MTVVVVAGGLLLVALLAAVVMRGQARHRDFLKERLGEDWDPRLRRVSRRRPRV